MTILNTVWGSWNLLEWLIDNINLLLLCMLGDNMAFYSVNILRVPLDYKDPNTPLYWIDASLTGA